jgi:hypothetical protein
METGLGLRFMVLPPEAFVLLDGRVLGRSSEYGSKGEVLTLPGAGTYTLTFRHPGMEDYRVRVDASAGRPVTPVSVRLARIPAAEVELADLEVYRAREAVALKVEPPDARVLVDGQMMGPASKFDGGMGRGGWLELPPGKHRVSLVAPGYQRVDLAVELTAGAIERRERIRVDLLREAGGG